MGTMSKEQILESLDALEQLPLEERKPEFSRLFRESCAICQSTPAEISHLTRINPEFVNGLYSGDFDSLPSEVFVRGFLKSISKQLKMPGETFVTAYSRTLRNSIPDLGRKSEDLESKKLGTNKKVPEKRLDKKTSDKKPTPIEAGKIEAGKIEAGKIVAVRTENKGSEWSFGDHEVVKPLYLENQHLTQGASGPRTQPLSTQKEFGTKNISHETLSLDPAMKESVDSDFLPMQETELAQTSKQVSFDAPSNMTGNSKIKGGAQSSGAFELVKKENHSLTQAAAKDLNKDLNKEPAKELGKEQGKETGFAFSKLWAVAAGVAVVLAAALWPRERAPNGTVIEESLVSPKSETSLEGEPQILEASPSPETESLTQGTPEVSGSQNASGLSSPAVPAAFNSGSGIPIVPSSPVVKGTLAIPEGKQVIEITAKEDVKIRAFIDGQTVDVDTLTPATHSYSFETNAEFFIYDAAAVDVSFNGRDLGSLGSKGKLRRLTFTKRLKDNKIVN
jgi:cytoskeletal protein RodZ